MRYMQYANLLVSYNNKEFFINHNENEAIIKYINSTEWFSGYDKMIKSKDRYIVESGKCYYDFGEEKNFYIEHFKMHMIK